MLAHTIRITLQLCLIYPTTDKKYPAKNHLMNFFCEYNGSKPNNGTIDGCYSFQNWIRKIPAIHHYKHRNKAWQTSQTLLKHSTDSCREPIKPNKSCSVCLVINLTTLKRRDILSVQTVLAFPTHGGGRPFV